MYVPCIPPSELRKLTLSLLFLQQGVVDEESTGIRNAGAGWLVEQGHVSPSTTDAVIITEPLNVDNVCLGHRGAIWGTITFKGVASHGVRTLLTLSWAVEVLVLTFIRRQRRNAASTPSLTLRREQSSPYHRFYSHSDPFDLLQIHCTSTRDNCQTLRRQAGRASDPCRGAQRFSHLHSACCLISQLDIDTNLYGPHRCYKLAPTPTLCPISQPSDSIADSSPAKHSTKLARRSIMCSKNSKKRSLPSDTATKKTTQRSLSGLSRTSRLQRFGQERWRLQWEGRRVLFARLGRSEYFFELFRLSRSF